MTRQYDKVMGRIGQIKIYSGGQLTDPSTNTNLIYEDCLMDFINLDLTKKRKITDFSRKYAFLPQDISEGWIKSLNEEQKEIKNVIEKINADTFSNEDLQKINAKCRGVVSEDLYLIDNNKFQEVRNSIKKLNGNNDYHDGMKVNKSSNYQIKAQTILSSTGRLWNELRQYISSKSRYKQCLDCKEFFEPNKHSPWQKFCTIYCKDRNNKANPN